MWKYGSDVEDMLLLPLGTTLANPENSGPVLNIEFPEV